MTSLGSGIFLFEILKDVSYAKTVARNLVGVGWADTLAGGANLVLTFLGLVGCVEHTVCRHDKVCFLRNMQAALQLVTTLLQRLSLVHEEIGSKYHTVTDNVHLSTLENTRGDGTKHVLLAFELQRMSGIGASLEAGYNVILWGQNVDHLSFTFIAPLQSEQDVNLTLIHLFLLFDFNFFVAFFIRVCLA